MADEVESKKGKPTAAPKPPEPTPAPKPPEPTPAPKPAARACEPGDRAGDGLRRFKLRASNAGGRGYRYVLAPDRDSAEACYLRAEGLDKLADGAEPIKVGGAELPD